MNTNNAELDDRIAKCQKILDADPNSQIFAALADAYRKKKMVEEAFEICRKGLEIHPDYASAYVVMTKISIDRGDYEEAERQLQLAIQAGGRTRSVDILQSEIFIKIGEKEKARTILGRLHKTDPMNDTVKRLLLSMEDKPAESKVELKMPEEIINFQTAGTDSSTRRAYSLSNALSIIMVLPRVLGVVAVGNDGIIIEGHFDGILSREEIGALASGAFDSIRQGITKIKLGAPREVLVESNESKLWMVDLDRMLLVISMRDDVNFGSLKLKVNEIFKNTVY